MRRRHLMPTLRRPLNCTVRALLSPKAIREEIGRLTDRAQAIADLAAEANRELTAEEAAEIDGILGAGKRGTDSYKPGKIDGLETQLARAEQLEARTAQLAAARGNDPANLLQRSDGPGRQAPDDSQPRAARVAIPATARFRHTRLRAFVGPHAEQSAYMAGQWFAATLFRHEAAGQWCQNLGLDTRFYGALSGDSNSLGGFLVPAEIEQAVIDLRERYGIFRQYAKVVPMARDTKDQPYRSSGLTAYFVGDNIEITASDKAWGNAKLVAKKLGCLCKYSSELDEDSILSIGDDLTSEIAYAFAVKEDDCGFNGTGTSTYGGIVGLVGALAAGSIHEALGGNVGFTTLDLVDFEAAMGKLPEYPGIQPAWFISKVGWANSMTRLQDAAGGNSNVDIAAGPSQRSFLGYPVVWSQSLTSALTSTTSTILAYFGDLRLAAVLGNRRGLSVQLSDQRYFELDQLGIKGTERFDINIHSRGDATTAGAIIALKTPGS